MTNKGQVLNLFSVQRFKTYRAFSLDVNNSLFTIYNNHPYPKNFSSDVFVLVEPPPYQSTRQKHWAERSLFFFTSAPLPSLSNQLPSPGDLLPSNYFPPNPLLSLSSSYPLPLPSLSSVTHSFQSLSHNSPA